LTTKCVNTLPAELKFVIFLYALSLTLGIGIVAAAIPSNPPSPDPYPSDNDPYPPTDANLYYDYVNGLTFSDFQIPVAGGTVTLKLVPKNLEQYAVGYFSDFGKGQTPSDPEKAAMNQRTGAGAYIWPPWVGDSTHQYVPGEESSYWNGWRFYYEDLPWENGDKDLDDLWVDIAWRHLGGNSIEIKAIVKCNRAGYANPFELTFERETGCSTMYFTYQIHEPSSGPDQSGGFALGDDPITMNLFETGDEGDWGSFYGTVPALPALAVPIGIFASVLLAKRRKK